MIPSTRGITPLRQRMIDDMRMRKLAPKTQTAYIRAVRKFAGYLGRSPDTAAAEDLRAFQLPAEAKGTGKAQKYGRNNAIPTPELSLDPVGLP